MRFTVFSVTTCLVVGWGGRMLARKVFGVGLREKNGNIPDGIQDNLIMPGKDSIICVFIQISREIGMMVQIIL